MRASEFITEIFQPGKKNWEWKFRGSEEAAANFTVGDRDYQWLAFSNPHSNPTKWEIQFRLLRNDTDPEYLDLFGRTGTGNSAQVLSTAVDITREFIKEYGLDKVEEITFNAKEDSRIALYAKMIKRLLPDWDLYQKYSKNNGMEYHLTDRRAYDKPQNKMTEGALSVDVPNEEWLQDAIDYAKSKSPDRNGLPYMGKTTATARHVNVPVDILRQIPGMRREQSNVRHNDLAAIMKIMSTTGKLPLSDTGEEYKPFINVAYDGSAWVNEGNHRIMAAAKLGWDTLPIEISYFDGGERIKSGPMYPPKIGL
jgi:hypothetical protein